MIHCPITIAHEPHRYWNGEAIASCPEQTCECPLDCSIHGDGRTC